jgi:hypothetical protein
MRIGNAFRLDSLAGGVLHEDIFQGLVPCTVPERGLIGSLPPPLPLLPELLRPGRC